MEFMGCQQHQKMRHKDEERLKQETKEEEQQTKQQLQPSAVASPSSSPSHEFSFTISLQPSSSSSSTSTSKKSTTGNSNIIPDNKTKSSYPASSFALDLSPADEIFFHGHLLPLHLLSHLPISPRSSTNSMDSFTIPIKELYEDQSGPQNPKNNSTTNTKKTAKSCSSIIDHDRDERRTGRRTKNSSSKSFSLFGLSSKWKKDENIKELDKERQQKKKLKFDVSHVLKRYMRMVRPLLSSLASSRRSSSGGNLEFHSSRQQGYNSYSGNLSLRRKPDHIIGRRGEFSAPASMRTSPTNSGLLVATSTTGNVSTCSSSTSDSTMEELQAAIQAAIAHCKKSIAMDDKIKCHDH
ncbi:hypothetical protein ACH5RR_035029 [Cinchona calisaya]|uniref:BRI1 kinase inhibitor 1 n=1 Tax=Cinchona calisaya TaxID=153742 RepID=A0ABD2YI03_9GENT